MLPHLFNSLERLDFLIHSKNAGSPAQPAEGLNMSEHYLYYVLGNMKKIGATITYCKTKKSYSYKENRRFAIEFFKV